MHAESVVLSLRFRFRFFRSSFRKTREETLVRRDRVCLEFVSSADLFHDPDPWKKTTRCSDQRSSFSLSRDYTAQAKDSRVKRKRSLVAHLSHEILCRRRFYALLNYRPFQTTFLLSSLFQISKLRYLLSYFCTKGLRCCYVNSSVFVPMNFGVMSDNA